MRTFTSPARRKNERGQTIVLVAISMFALISMAAIAIDLTTLYVARNEAQQAVDAAALAGAKAFVSSGFTSGYVDLATAETLASNQALAAGQQLRVAGQTLQSSEFTVTFPQTTPSNPLIAVTVAHTGVPTFFAKIWGVRTTNVGATAAAEAYNPSGSDAAIQVSAVKPFLIPDCPPNQFGGSNNCGPTGTNAFFINPVDGSIMNSGSFIGQTIQLTLPPNTVGSTGLTCPGGAGCGNQYSFFPVAIPIEPPAPFCPASSLASCSLLGNGQYFDNIACSNPTQLSCGQIVGGPSPGSTNIPVDTRANGTIVNWGQLQSRVTQGTQCLIHTSTAGLGNGQDSFSAPVATGQRILISPGSNNPDPSLANATNISRSDSVISVPLFDGSNLCDGGTCTTYTAQIVGFLQVGITQNTGPGSVEAVILNASGCVPTPSGQTVTGGSISSIPVRLVQHP
jgi:Flp pilus assembly protein TadG